MCVVLDTSTLEGTFKLRPQCPDRLYITCSKTGKRIRVRFNSTEAEIHHSDDSKERTSVSCREIPPAGGEERTVSQGFASAGFVSGRQHDLVVRAGAGGGWEPGPLSSMSTSGWGIIGRRMGMGGVISEVVCAVPGTMELSVCQGLLSTHHNGAGKMEGALSRVGWIGISGRVGLWGQSGVQQDHGRGGGSSVGWER
ncbi:milk lysozyme [Platysternon megacephalum]|uniref:Milk lysozyme n=1 Tax=Platysternon megacephalum TaxID=55544 RepID=A0A4D9DH28_9SAUR|nr:milk lysozyme [Platysternon megacephalum]